MKHNAFTKNASNMSKYKNSSHQSLHEKCTSNETEIIYRVPIIYGSCSETNFEKSLNNSEDQHKGKQSGMLMTVSVVLKKVETGKTHIVKPAHTKDKHINQILKISTWKGGAELQPRSLSLSSIAGEILPRAHNDIYDKNQCEVR